MLLIYVDPATAPTNEAEGEAMSKEYWTFTQSIVDSGELVAGDPLEGIETATTVRVREGRTAATDGPFAETKEVLGGYYIVDCKDLDRAIELAGQIPGARTGSVEVRPVVDMSQAG
jgi:hypothetical protein